MASRVSNNRGFTLIELLIAAVLILISMLAFLSTMLTAIQANVENDRRNTAVRVANQTAESLLALPMNDPELDAGAHTRVKDNAVQGAKGLPDVDQSIRNFREIYAINWTVVDQPPDSKQILIAVQYTPKTGKTYTYEVPVFKHRTK